jgi:hypothetical protein
MTNLKSAGAEQPWSEAPGHPRTVLTLRQRAILGWGRLRRISLALFRPGYVRASLARRTGQCNRSGACCRLMVTCPLLIESPLPVRCGVHNHKPPVCNLFPIDERDLRDRDIVSPGVPCGYSFAPRAPRD